MFNLEEALSTLNKYKILKLKRNYGNEYENQQVVLEEKLEVILDRLMRELKKLGIKKLNVISLGNSIATGYSENDIIKPYLMRSDKLKEQCEREGIALNTYGFARAQYNSDEEIFDWVHNNKKLSEINREVRNSLRNIGAKFNEEDYPINPQNDKGIRDIIMESGGETLTIVLYNGLTGSFLDDISRGGKHIFKGLERDQVSMEAVLKEIKSDNPLAQVYVYGLPLLHKPIGLLANIIENPKIRKACEYYPNASYVEPAPINMLYENKEGVPKFDFHPDKPEYLMSLGNGFSVVADNCVRKMVSSELYDKLYHISRDDAQYGDDTSKWFNWDYVLNTALIPMMEKYKDVFDTKEQKIRFFEGFEALYRERYSHNFYFIPKEEVISELQTRLFGYGKPAFIDRDRMESGYEWMTVEQAQGTGHLITEEERNKSL